MARELPIILILGPTAGGKTALSLALAEGLPGECVCADSMQVYRGMNIGTAKPAPAERRRVPHHLMDIADPRSDGFTVDTWLELAELAIGEIRARGRHPIVVGGTNLYVRALLEGLFDGPGPDAALRSRLAALSDEELRAWLARIDPDAAERIHRKDRRRTIRAIEVHEVTGTPISRHQTQWDAGNIRGDVRIIGLDWPVPAVNRRINTRVRQMIADGLVEEVRSLRTAGPLAAQAAAALGYRQILDHLEGRLDLEEAVEQIKIKTRRFAKQQRTWLRKFRACPGSRWLAADVLDSQLLVNQALEFIRETADKPPETPSANHPPE